MRLIEIERRIEVFTNLRGKLRESVAFGVQIFRTDFDGRGATRRFNVTRTRSCIRYLLIFVTSNPLNNWYNFQY